MTRIIITILIVNFIACNCCSLTLIEEGDLIKRIVEQEMPNPSMIKLLTENMTEISLDSLKILEQTGNYFEDFYVNKNNEIVQLIIRPKTQQDQQLLNKINLALNPEPEVNIVDIDCGDKVNILQSAYERDQGMGNGRSDIDPKIDHNNLEIIVSFLEKCGMPTLSEVNDTQMSGIWLVLQHAPPKYQSKYIPLLKESATKGDIEMSVIALIEDRALMYEGKQQIFGSQVQNGELYNLFEPEYVDQRREEIGMENLKDYLRRFDIEFNIEQKRK